MRQVLLRGTAVVIVLSGALLTGTLDCRLPGGLGLTATAWAEEAWRTEFDDVCSRTSDAMNFSAAELQQLVARCDKLKPQIEALTPAERRILKLIGEDYTSKEIASLLKLSVRTVDNHRQHICNKLKLHGTHSLLKFAFDNSAYL